MILPWKRSSRRITRQFGSTSACGHEPPRQFAQPNGAFPLRDGHFLVTEILGNWVDEMSLDGRVYWSAHPPGVSYPSDANEMSPGRYIVADYSYPGQIVIFSRTGQVVWRFRAAGAALLNHPSLALPLPNGNILVNDDCNDRVIVINIKTNRIVWQYGHDGVPGRAAGVPRQPRWRRPGSAGLTADGARRHDRPSLTARPLREAHSPACRTECARRQAPGQSAPRHPGVEPPTCP